MGVDRQTLNALTTNITDFPKPRGHSRKHDRFLIALIRARASAASIGLPPRCPTRGDPGDPIVASMRAMILRCMESSLWEISPIRHAMSAVAANISARFLGSFAASLAAATSASSCAASILPLSHGGGRYVTFGGNLARRRSSAVNSRGDCGTHPSASWARVSVSTPDAHRIRFTSSLGGG